MSNNLPLLHPLRTLLILSSVGISFSGVPDRQVFAQTATETNALIARQPAKSKTQFLRLSRDKNGAPSSLQTALTRYKPANGGLVVDLIAAVHVGEADYYSKLNRQFELYDVVLYELVAPAGTRVPAGGKTDSNHPLGMIQGSLQSMLGLESQLKKVDYQKKNFVHADMTPAQMAAKMKQRGDTAFTIGLSAFTEILRQQNQAASSSESGTSGASADEMSISELLDTIGDPLKMKRMMATQFTESGAMDLGLGKTLNRMLIDDRNEVAMKVLNQQLAAGQKKIAVFYGAAHMPDFERRLAELNMRKTDQVWVDAWDLTKAKSVRNDPTRMLFKMLNELSK